MIPFRLDPIQPALVKPFHRDGYVYEEKLDGWRIVAYKNGPRVRLVSRTNTEHSRTFPNIAAAIVALPIETLILDGEVCAFDADRASSLAPRQRRPCGRLRGTQPYARSAIIALLRRVG